MATTAENGVVPFTRALVNGLAPYSDVPRNADFLTTLTNLQCCERRLKPLPAITYSGTLPAAAMSWPHQQLHQADNVALLTASGYAATVSKTALTGSQIIPYDATGTLAINNLDNPNFTGSADEWTLGSGDVVYGTNKLVATLATTTVKQALADMLTPWVAGAVYTVSFVITRTAGTINVGTNTTPEQTSAISVSGGYSVEVTADAHADGLVFTLIGFSGTIDSVSVRGAYKAIPASSNAFQFAAAQDIWFLTNGATSGMVYSIPSNSSNRVVVTDGTLSVNAVAMWNDRLVLGGVAGSRLSSQSFLDAYAVWQSSSNKSALVHRYEAFDTSYVAISHWKGGDNRIPYAAMLALFGYPSDATYLAKYQEMVHGWLEKGYLILHPCRKAGPIQAIRPFGNDLIVYGRDAIVRLNITEAGVMDEVLLDVGIAGRMAVNGDEEEQLFVTKHGELYMLGARGQSYGWAEPTGTGLFRLNYKQYITTMTLNDALMVSYDPTEKYYWIADSDECYALSRTGLFRSVGLIPSSVQRFSGSTGLVGTVLTSGSQAVTIKTNLFDSGLSELWEVYQMHLRAADTAASSADRFKVTMEARMHKNDALTAFTTGVFPVYVDGRGKARISLSGTDFTATITAADRTKVELDDLLVEVGRGNPSMDKWLDA
jgi:hypothetical protein